VASNTRTVARQGIWSSVLQEIHAGLGIGLAAVAKKFPGRGGGSVNAATVFRWCTSGCRGTNSDRVRLEHVRVGSRIVTSWPAVERFIVELTGSSNEVAAPPRTRGEQKRAADRAGSELGRMGC
jgi:hypothetical protein